MTQAEGRLDQHRVGQQGQHRAEVRQGVEPVGRRAGTGLDKPRLDQGARGGQHEIGQSDRDAQQTENAPDGHAGVGRFPRRGRNDG